MIELPQCRYRTSPLDSGRYGCTIPPSKVLVSPSGVSVETCQRCSFADREFPNETPGTWPPAALKIEPLPDGAERLRTCRHRPADPKRRGAVKEDGRTVIRMVL